MPRKKALKRTGPGRLTAEEAEGLNDRLLDAAQALFAGGSYGGTTMEAIARKARASTKTLYARYANKGEILSAVIRRSIACTAAETEAMVTPNQTQGDLRADPRAVLLTMAQHVGASLAGTSGALSRVVMSEAHRYPELAKLYREVNSQVIGLTTPLFEKWRDAGLLPDLKDPRAAADAWFALMGDRLRTRAILGLPMNRAEIDAYIGSVVDIFLRGCGYRPK
jgi:AcrR family transcriptional regulator